jgi:Flp pilus assembly protein TadG
MESSGNRPNGVSEMSTVRQAVIQSQTMRSLWRDSEGTALVEATIVIPVLLVLLFGVFEFSAFFWRQQLISTGVRDAARYLSRSLNPSSPAVETAAENLAVTGSTSGGTPRVFGWSGSDITISFTVIDNPVAANGTSPYRGPAVIQVVTVSTSYTHRSLGFLDYLGLPNLVIQVSHSERVIGPT